MPILARTAPSGTPILSIFWNGSKAGLLPPPPAAAGAGGAGAGAAAGAAAAAYIDFAAHGEGKSGEEGGREGKRARGVVWLVRDRDISTKQIL